MTDHDGTDDLIITVRGESSTRVRAAHAVVQMTVTGDGPDRAGVISAVGDIADPIRRDLDDRLAAGSISAWAGGRVSVWSERPWNEHGAQLPPVHHASLDLSVTIADDDVLSRWLSEIAAHSGIRVGSVVWDVSRETRAALERDAAASAVLDAVERATAYARAVGRERVRPIEIADAGLIGRAAEEGAAAKSLMRSDAAVAPALAIRADEIVITAVVEARFRAQ